MAMIAQKLAMMYDILLRTTCVPILSSPFNEGREKQLTAFCIGSSFVFPIN